MFEYKKCDTVSDDLIYGAFSQGFSDYMFKFTLTQDEFINHFFGPEGNKRELSFIALDEGKAIGLVFGGIRKFDGLKTLRCGTMCIIPEYRRKGIAQKLIDLHEKTARENNCDQMFLECIVGNDRALKFYEKNNYYRSYDIFYYSSENRSWYDGVDESVVEKTDIKEIDQLRQSSDSHMNWQNEIEFLEQLESSIYGIKIGGEIVAGIVMRKKRIHILYVKKEHRNRGLGKALIKKVQENPDEKITVSFPNNHNLEGFYRHLGFTKDSSSQVEMYRDM